MRYWNTLALTLLIGCLSGPLTAKGSIAARVQAATAARSQSASSVTTAPQTKALAVDADQEAMTAKPARNVPPRELALPTLDAPQSNRQGPSNWRPLRHTAATPPTPGNSTRINVADWFNATARQESSEQLQVVPIQEPADQPPASPTLSSRRRTTLRFSPANESPISELPPTLSAIEDETPMAEPRSIDTPADEDTWGEPAILAAADGKPIETQSENETTPPASEPPASEPPISELQPSQAKPPREKTTEEKTTEEETTEEKADPTQEPEEEEDDEQQIAPPVPPKKLSPQMLRLRDRIRSCLMYYYQRPENTAKRSPWGVMHSLISFGVDTELLAGNRRVNAIGWLCYNRPCNGMQLLQLDNGRVAPKNGPGYQGHEGQLLSMLALSRVKSTYPIRVEGQKFTVQDLIEYEKWTCRPKTELTFKLIALAHYLPSDATWTSKWGEEWDIPRLIREELAQPINDTTCGGTHRLIGYSMAVKVRQKRGEPIDGQWLRAEKYVDNYHKYVIKLQNRDGSFSTSWLKKRDDSGEIDRRIQTTGHILEWLVFSLPEEELTDPRVLAAVNYLNNALLSNRTREWAIGPRGHALRALALYNERVFGDKPGQRRAMLARRPKQ